ncbi:MULTISPECIES: ABC transporter ATP-binding protein [unclassified Vibrio]|uniref:ABC transporter ATP-binding protein n=1 Tax=Vibrio sp. HB236076 TaxID=3232307 RepID=A0AB39HIW9_9VIBR|nr:ABC transporter ATP-binding protein [Vibrio sp. HB161653]MDP5254976.1 ABC transporter ATP-binding protein [Vibrio sp. HB161653]
MSKSVIRAESIRKLVSTNQEDLTILDKVNFSIQQGETVAIVGASGAGKSTLMTLLAGLDTASEGDVYLFDKPLSRLDDEQRAQLRGQYLGFVFQSFLLIESLTALENVTLPCLLAGKEEDNKRAVSLLESVGLGHRLHHTPAQLSGGEQQRVAIARAFMTQPKVLFADEPTGNLDQNTAQNIVDLLFALNVEHGTTLVLVTHDPKLAQRCQRCFEMTNGQIKEV